MTNLAGSCRHLFPTAANELPHIVRGEGARLYDERGREYLDGSSGAIAASLGHGNGELVSRIAHHGSTLGFVHRTHFRSRVTERFAERLAGTTPGDLDVSLLLSSGSDAIEAAMKFTLRYWQIRGRPTKTRFVSRNLSYHGSTLGASSLTGHPARRGPAAALLHPFASVRGPDHGGIADDFETTVLRIGPERIAAFVSEPIGGSSSGVLVPARGYHERVREICDRYDIWWIADEVMTGVGRTGRWWACQHWDAVPDVLVSGKGLGGGYMPLSAITVRAPAARAVVDHDGFVAFGHTFTNAPQAAAAGLATLDIIERDDLVGRAAALGERLDGELAGLDGGGLSLRVRGAGLFWGIELRDAQTGNPFPPELDVVRLLSDACREVGLIVFRSARHVGGVEGDTVLFAPPLTVTDAELTEMLVRLSAAIDRVATSVPMRRAGEEAS